MPNTFFISDTHFGHAKLLTFETSSRAKVFSNIKEHDETLIDNWNKVVRPHDIVIHLGDVVFGHPEILHRLNGEKSLVLGNHDKLRQLYPFFHNIYGCRKYKYRDLRMILTHIPVVSQQVSHRFTHNVHGHMHDHIIMYEHDDWAVNDAPIRDRRYINVSVEQINYTPISIEELYAGLQV